ncbi:MAG: methyltransferase domain-containing protein [Actinobacteria bacterium]|nr:methyltransferase domain-containing protein [Actinomycetota bacterium]
MTSAAETFQITAEAAEMYESKFVPRLFGEWAKRLVESANIEPGQRVLDVACGTGVVARTVADRIGASGSVAGLDLNEAMLSVARRLRPDLEWRQGDAADLPFADASFDVVLCQAALMFFPDVALALREMSRVVTPGGTVALQVWNRREDQPAYRPFIDVAGRHAGPEAVSLLSAYFAMGDLGALTALLASTGLDVSARRTQTSVMRFGSVDELVAVEVESTPLGERLRPDVLTAIVEDSRRALEPFHTADGELDIPIAGHIIIAHAR